jgi:hypothetical protein
MLYPYEFGQSGTDSPAPRLVTRPPTLINSSVASMVSQANRDHGRLVGLLLELSLGWSAMTKKEPLLHLGPSGSVGRVMVARREVGFSYPGAQP